MLSCWCTGRVRSGGNTCIASAGNNLPAWLTMCGAACDARVLEEVRGVSQCLQPASDMPKGSAQVSSHTHGLHDQAASQLLCTGVDASQLRSHWHCHRAHSTESPMLMQTQ
jgi:hypothetical protein